MDINSASAVLQASVTGAGLTFAIFGVIIPILKDLQSRQLQIKTDIVQQILQKSKTNKIDSDEFRELLDKYDAVEPTFFSTSLILSTFILYGLAALLSIGYLISPSIPLTDLAPLFFAIAMALFMVLGISALRTILDIISSKSSKASKKSK